MKNYKILSFALLLSSILNFASCYDDKSTLATSEIPEVQISMSDESLSNTIYVGYQIPIDIIPTITQHGSDGSNLLYEWSLSEETGSINLTFETISTEKEFHGIINRPISNSAYTLILTITDTVNNDLQYVHSWNLIVQSSFLDGVLIADSQDGTTTDLTLVNNSTLTNNYETGKAEQVFRQILTNAKGQPYNGLLTSLFYEIVGNGSLTTSAHTNQIWAISSTAQSVRFNCEDYSINGSLEDERMFLYRPSDFQVKSYIRSSQLFIANTNNGLYSFINTVANKFSMPTAPLKGYEINNNICAANSSYEINNNHLVWLDKPKGAFYSLSGTSFMTCSPYESTAAFDPNNMSNQTALAATSSQDGSLATFLLKNDINGEYAIYILSQYKAEEGYYEDPDNWEGWIVTSPEQPASAKNKFTIPSSGKVLLDKAVSVFFGHTNNVLYVATNDAVYAFTYGMGDEVTVSTISQFTPTAGEKITKAKLYQQGQYTNQINTMTGISPDITPNAWNNKALIIVTQSEEYKGKVTIVPMKQASAGTLDPSKALTYEGFGKILDVTTTGY